MPHSNATFLQDLGAFIKDSLTWCAQESEAEVAKIYETLTLVLDDLKRRSAMSEKALGAVIFLQDQLVQDKTESSFDQVLPLVDALERLGSDHVEVRDLTSPIVEALQFQDRVRQYLENIVKMYDVWLTTHRELQAGSEIELVDFGKKLLGCTVSIEERQVVRQVIDGLPDEVQSEDVTLF